MPKAVQFDSYGGVDVLEVRDVPRPVLEAGEVLVEVRAAGINPSEAVIRSGARLFPGQIPGTTVTAVPAENNRLELEGHRLDIVDVGHTDTDAASVLHVPDLDLVVAGDAIYNGVHLYLAESADGGRDKWRSAIDIVESLDPRWNVAGHKNKDLDDTATRAISETRNYLDSADELLSQQATALGFFNAMLERYPDRLNPGVVWMSANALYR
jgi:glyoxylase-like metal-dependent hydrolase (beta-lactamase superfamily II)